MNKEKLKLLREAKEKSFKARAYLNKAAFSLLPKKKNALRKLSRQQLISALDRLNKGLFINL